MYRHKKIGVVIPAYNVEAHLKATIEGLPDMVDRVYVVDDGSTDNTSGAVKNCSDKVSLFRHAANRGPGATTATGCLAALQDNLDIVVKLDGDGQMPSDRIESLILPIIKNEADYTKGDRLSHSHLRRTMPRFRLLGNILLTYLTRIASGYWHVNDTQNGFIAISNRALHRIDIGAIYPYYGYLNDILVRLNAAGFAIKDIPMPARYGNEKSSIRLGKYITRVSLFLLRRFIWRVKTKYLANGQWKGNGKEPTDLSRYLRRSEKPLKILVKIGHPADVHFFKNFYWRMKNAGHQVLICATDKDVAIELLKAYRLKYVLLGKSGDNPLAKLANLVKSDYRVWQIARKFKPDILTGMMQVEPAHISVLLRKPSIIFDDTEHAKAQYLLYSKFASVIGTPSSFKKHVGSKQFTYNGCHALAYLHPNYFTPDPSVPGELGLTETDKFIILRFVAWRAIHDLGHDGFTLETKRKLVKELEKHARVLITSETTLPPDLDKYRIRLPAAKLHHLLYYAALYIGEGATVASECAVLGTPALYFNPLKLGYLEEEESYGLVFNYSDAELPQERVLEKALELLRRPDLKEEWRAKAKNFLRDKIDLTSFMVDFIGAYPDSFYKCRETPAPQILSSHLPEGAKRVISEDHTKAIFK